jgi:hypothetical protein
MNYKRRILFSLGSDNQDQVYEMQKATEQTCYFVKTPL